ncbi:T9SS type A sorting domain-containing protein [Algoriphagus marincola]|uniref:T9SS type A sorting domain-containing protein n=1 Tax=Algoriphagus marincola TaxID=264027 RepID=A0ABS7N6D5_9BACT|nr:YCF48-related protein [Algoriphagus marincola]MBY5951897.1 T9SS type A sorting domain-containing protein [Algoriphagus marincola]
MMRKYLLFIFTIFMFSSFAKGQTFSQLQSWGLDFESIYWTSNLHGVIVGEQIIAVTEDGGESWQEVPRNFDFRFFDLTFLSEITGIAVGEQGQVYYSLDGGKTWESSDSGTTKDIFSVSKINETEAIAVGADGLIIKSTDEGKTWVEVGSNLSANLYEVDFSDSGLGVLAGDQGLVAQSKDMGETWEITSVATSENLKSIKISASGKVYAAGEAGTIIHSLDTGKTWTSIQASEAVDFYSLSIGELDERIINVAGANNALFRSVNSGTSFSKINLPAQGSERTIKKLSFKPGENTIYAVGQDGYSITSTNAGNSWALKLLGNRVDFYTLEFLSNTFAIAAGTEGKFFVTTNAFRSVIERPIPDKISILTADFWNGNYGFVAGENGNIYRTSNGGQSWTPLPIQTNQSLKGIHLFLPEFPYLSGQSGLIVRSSGTSGNSWELFQQETTDTDQDINDLLGFDLQNAMTVGEGGYISISNNGSDWPRIESGTENDLYFTSQLSDSTAIVVGEKGTILKTGDLGRSWKKIPTEYEIDFLGVDFFDDKTGFIVGKEGLFLISVDGGESWTKFDSKTKRDLYAIQSVNPNKAFAVGKDGVVIGYDCVPPSGGLAEISGPSFTCLEMKTYTIADSPAPGSEITWRVDGGNIISGQGTSEIEVEWTDPGRKGVFVSRQNFCGSGETSYMEVIVSDIPPQNLQIQGEGTTCVDQTETYALPTLEGVTYTWNAAGGTIISGQGTAEVEVEWTQAGQTTLTATPENSCGTIDPVLLPIQVIASPSQPGEIQGESILAPGNYFYEVQNQPNFNFQWQIEGEGRILSGQGTNRVEVSWVEEGEYSLTVAAQNACGFGPERSLPIIVSLVTSLEPSPDIKGLKVFPNPSTGRVFIEAEFLDQWNSIDIIDPNGKPIEMLPINKGQKRIEIKNLRPGLYFIRMTGSADLVVRKILVQ